MGKANLWHTCITRALHVLQVHYTSTTRVSHDRFMSNARALHVHYTRFTLARALHGERGGAEGQGLT